MSTPTEFEWDEHNIRKNWEKHKVAFSECEEVFFNEPLWVAKVDRSRIIYEESRYLAYGTTNAKRLLLAVFTLRGDKIRVISVRDMNRKERRFYQEETKKAR